MYGTQCYWQGIATKRERNNSYNDVGFPVEKRPLQPRRTLENLTPADEAAVDKLLDADLGLLRPHCTSPDRQRRGCQLLATWPDLFVDSIFDLPETNPICYRICPYAQVRPAVARLSLFTHEDEQESQWQKSPDKLKLRRNGLVFLVRTLDHGRSAVIAGFPTKA